MKHIIKCKECGYEYELEELVLKATPYLQCQNPDCMRISKNPFYEG